jgi:hypothetical protein
MRGLPRRAKSADLWQAHPYAPERGIWMPLLPHSRESANGLGGSAYRESRCEVSSIRTLRIS